MNKLSMLGIIGGAALLAAVPFSLQWSQEGSAVPLLTVSHAKAQTAGTQRRQARRASIQFGPRERTMSGPQKR